MFSPLFIHLLINTFHLFYLFVSLGHLLKNDRLKISPVDTACLKNQIFKKYLYNFALLWFGFIYLGNCISTLYIFMPKIDSFVHVWWFIFSMFHCNSCFCLHSYIVSSILIQYKYFTDNTQAGTSTLWKTGPWHNGNKRVIHTQQISLTESSPLDTVTIYQPLRSGRIWHKVSF